MLLALLIFELGNDDVRTVTLKGMGADLGPEVPRIPVLNLFNAFVQLYSARKAS